MNTNNLNICTYNTLHPEFAERHKIPSGLTTSNGKIHSNWSTRKARVAKNVLESSAAIICFQEIADSTLAGIKTEMTKLQKAHPSYPTYTFLDIAKHEKTYGKKKLTHGVTIAYDPTKVTKSTARYLRLHPQNKSYRGALIAEFCHNKTGKIVRVATAHLRYYDSLETDLTKKQAAMETGFLELKELIEEATKTDTSADYVLFAGDCNEGTSEMLLENSRLNFLQEKKFKCDGCTKPSDVTRGRIDWIYCKSTKTTKEVSLKPLVLQQDVLASDHLMVGTTLEIPVTATSKKRNSPRLRAATLSTRLDPPLLSI